MKHKEINWFYLKCIVFSIGCALSWRIWDTAGVLRAGHASTGAAWELGRAACFLVKEYRNGENRNRRTLARRAVPACARAGKKDHECTGTVQGTGKRAKCEVIRDGHAAVLADHTTDEGGEARPKRPAGGKVKPGITKR